MAKMVTNGLAFWLICGIFAAVMYKGLKETFSVRMMSVGFAVLTLAVFKPFGLDAWQWQGYAHLLVICILGMAVCLLSEGILRYIFKMPHSFSNGVGYIIRRNLWFQVINTPIEALMICLYRHYVLSDHMPSNLLSWANYLGTLVVIIFCSFFIGLYWRFKFRSRYLAAELEETRRMNEQLKRLTADHQQGATFDVASTEDSHPAEDKPCAAASVTLTGTTSETVTFLLKDLLYVEAVGNYVKVYHLDDKRVRDDMLRATSKQIEEELSPYPLIVRCHRAFLVNLAQVEQFVSRSGNMQLLMKQGHDSILVSRSNVAKVKEALKLKCVG